MRPTTAATGPPWLIVGLVILQVAAGGFVAGLDAGMGYNTWPLMDGQIVPKGLFIAEPWWRNIFENAMTVQFDHRLLAYVIAVVIAGYAYIVQRRAAALMLARRVCCRWRSASGPCSGRCRCGSASRIRVAQ